MVKKIIGKTISFVTKVWVAYLLLVLNAIAVSFLCAEEGIFRWVLVVAVIICVAEAFLERKRMKHVHQERQSEIQR